MEALCGEATHNLGDDCCMLGIDSRQKHAIVRTVKSDNAKDEDNGQGHDHHGVDLESGRLIGVEP